MYGFGHPCLCWRERDQRYPDDNQRKYGGQQISARDHIAECLHRHNGGVNKARPRREGDQAAIL